MPDYLADLRLAHRLADDADRITMSRFGRQDLRVQHKADATAVTDADLAAERELRSVLARTRPDDAVQGEEFGHSGNAGRRWVLDPIDGTANYLRGVPIWATLIALVDDGEATLGLVSAPALGLRWWAATGLGSHRGRNLDDSALNRVSAVSQLADAFVSYSSLHGWRAIGRYDAFLGILAAAGRTRGFGDFFSYMLLAEGAVDVACEPDLALHDVAALVPIVREAGGVFTSVEGGDPLTDLSALAATPGLHPDLLGRLG